MTVQQRRARRAAFKVGDEVTLMPPWDDLPYIFSFQHYARVAEVRNDDTSEPSYLVTLDAALPPDERFGPFLESRLTAGWRNESDRWRVAK